MENNSNPRQKSLLRQIFALKNFILIAIAFLLFCILQRIPQTVENSDQAVDLTPIYVAEEQTQEIVNQADEKNSTLGDYVITIQEGDTLSGIFSHYGISKKDLWDILSLPEVKKLLPKMRPGHEIKFSIDNKHRLQKFIYQITPTKSLFVTRPEPKLTAYIEEQPLETTLTQASGKVGLSLYQSAHEAQIPDKIIMQLAEIFAWKIDFNKDLWPEDRFDVIYQKDFIGGKEVHTGNIVAAEFINHGRKYRALRYKLPNGKVKYYTPEGNSLQKAFIRTPVKYKYISSPYNPNRMHPILGVKRPHLGVDLAAASGTPIKASGDGKLIYVGKRGGYGNVVVIDHGHGITTLYAHLKKAAKGMYAGRWVKQGDLIAYVGSTGLATGPHLHYEYRINGRTFNPMTVKLPHAKGLPSNLKNNFKAKTKSLVAKLDTGSQTMIAEKDVEEKSG